jgi:hypothetical protein
MEEFIRRHGFPRRHIGASNKPPSTHTPMKRFTHVMIVSVLLSGAGILSASDKQAPAPASKEAKCCTNAAKNEKDCTHPCCVEAAKAGNHCAKCGGSGPRETKK